ncbi:MAG: sugar transferase [Thermodesulfobacteriota bacterium]
MRFPLRFSERRLVLIFLDLIALNGSLLLFLDLRADYQLSWRLISENPLWFIILSLLWLFIGFAFDVYDLRVVSRFSTTFRPVLFSGLITIGIYLLIPYISPSLPKSRFTIFSFFLLTVFLLLMGRLIYRFTLTQPLFTRRALIVGTGPSAHLIAKTISENTNGIFQLVGFIQDSGREKNSIEKEYPREVHLSGNPEVKTLGGLDELLEIIKENQVNTLILATEEKADGRLLQTLTDSMELGVEIIPMQVLYEKLTGRVPVEHIGESWQVAMPIDHPLTRPFNSFVKRISDIILATLGCICLAPFFPFIALAIYIESPGPIFYAQTRVGRNGRIFKAYKFRSMVPNAEKDRPVWAGKNDPRVTRVGRLLRKTHVDEFPQFWNILKGEMSAVGPRPERPEFVEELAGEIPFYRVRHAVKPGMAAWGLVKQGYGASKEDALVKLQYDLYYIKHQSFFFDLVILLKTIIDTLTFRGRA